MRKCNECTLCCKLLPVGQINKPANTVCANQRSKGCRVYGTNAFPSHCGIWSCLWLLDESVPLPRPDRARYVIDPSPEFAEINGHTVDVLQIWIDPRCPTAHRDPALRDWLANRWATHKQLAIVRHDSLSGTVLIPPSASGACKWIESQGTATAEHSMQEIYQRLKQLRRRDTPAQKGTRGGEE